MRPYETLVVLSTSLGSGMQPLIENLHGIITTGGGTLDASHDWGQRRLAYQIQKQSEGHYFLIEYSCEPEAVLEVERNLRITDGVLRYLTVQQEHTGLPKPRERELPRGDTPLHEMRSSGSPPPPRADASADDRPAVVGEAATPAASAESAGTPNVESSSVESTSEPTPAAAAATQPEAGQGEAPDKAASASSDDGVKSDE